MPSRKKISKKNKEQENAVQINMGLLTRKMNQLGKELDVLQIDVKDMAVELLKISDEHIEKQSLINRIKARLGL